MAHDNTDVEVEFRLMPPTQRRPKPERPEGVPVATEESTMKVLPHFYRDEGQGEWVLEVECRFPAEPEQAWAVAAAITALCTDVLDGNWELEPLPEMVPREGKEDAAG